MWPTAASDAPHTERLLGDWEQFEAGMNAKERRDLRRRRRRLDELGAVSVDDVTEADGLDERLSEAFSVEGSDWKDRRRSAIRASDATVGFYTEVAHWAARQGYLRLTFLRLEGEPLAMSFALWADGVHYGLKMGYKVEFAKYVPGLLLMHEIMRAAFAAGLRRVEMLGEDDPYKRIWCDRTRERIGMQAFAPSLGGIASWAAFDAAASARGATGCAQGSATDQEPGTATVMAVMLLPSFATEA